MILEVCKLPNNKSFKLSFCQQNIPSFLMILSNQEQVFFFMGLQELEKRCWVSVLLMNVKWALSA